MPRTGYINDAWGNILTVTDTSNISLATLNPLRYRGYVYDHETGLYYLQSRYYDPEIGRFLNADAFVSTGQGQLGNNMFAYCHNNPVIYVDPSGCIIVLADDTTEEQKKEYERAVAYIKTSETGRKLVLLLEESAVVFTIVFVDDNNMSYNTVNKVIRFDPNCGMVVADGSSVQSPAMGLAHEMGHAAQDLDGLSLATGVEREVLEAMNLKYYEIPIAKELGEPIHQKYKDARMSVDMQNSTHFRTTTFLPRLSFWERLLPWNWFRPDRILTEHNLDE